LKRLIVGGYEKIFEIARNFRNEGIDQTHQPEFTMIEWYEAYADYQRMMNVTESLIKHLVEVIHDSTKLEIDDHQVDLSQTWPRITMLEAIEKYLDFDFTKLSDQEIKDYLGENQIELTGSYSRGKAQFAIFDKLVTPQLIDPVWIIDYPREVSPLAKAHRLDPQMAERFEGYIGGKELADGWSEIVDPLDQRRIFGNEQQRLREGDEEAHPTDEDFLRALEYGLPPLGGIGIGIDRLVMFITNTWNIKEVIAFPTLRPLQKVEPVETTEQKEKTPITIAANDHELPDRELAEQLLTTYIEDENLRHHARMVATAMAAYAQELDEDQELWYQTGLLHDLDWEKYPEAHPKKAIEEILAADYPTEMLVAIAGHAPQRTGIEPESKLAKYLYACDELTGFIHAYSLMRPTNYEGMKARKVKKKLKDSSFAAGVNREDIERGFTLIEPSPDEHINFLIKVFNQEL
jgi:lysyl-tRNA synthetase class 2